MNPPKEVGFDKQFNFEINGYTTEFVLQKFHNRWLVIITQYGKLPNLYTVKFDINNSETAQISQLAGPVVEDPQFHRSLCISMNCIFGADKDEVRAGIQYLMNKTVLKKCSTELLIGMGLKEVNAGVLREVAAVVNEMFL